MNPIVDALQVLDQEPRFLGKIIDNLDDYITWDTIEYCLNNPQFYPIDLIKDNSKISIPVNQYHWLGSIANKKFIIDSVNQGKTFIILNYSHNNQTTASLMEELTKKFNVHPDIHVYGGLLGSDSFSIHKDYPPNIIVQVYGETPWKIWKGDITNTPDINIVLKPGEVLYVPGGLYHVASPTTQRVSMSIPCWPNLASDNFEFTDRNFYKINYR